MLTETTQANKENRKKPRIHLIGMPHADSSFFEMNIGQLPQGPEVTLVKGFPKKSRKKINNFFVNIFNPTKKTPYMGIRLIVQNLRDYIDFTIDEYPDNDEAVVRYVRENEDLTIIGIAIGCENRVYQAKELARKILSASPAIKIVFGNYGAVAGKKLGILTEEEGFVLWDGEKEREQKKKENKDFYTGEGVHDMRLWLREEGLDGGNPHAPLISESIPDPDLTPEHPVARWLTEKIGFLPMPNDANKIGVSIGCTNNCSFCNTRFKFNRSKTFLYRKAQELFNTMEEVFDANNARHDFPPEALFFLMDENFMKDEKVQSGDGKINFLEVAEGLCDLIAESGKNIHWGTFSDVKSLLNYKKRNGSFIGLVRGGLQSVWIGLESREDVFDKRGGATSAEVEEMIREIQSLGITIIGSFIPGLEIHTEGPSKRRYESLGAFKKLLEEENSVEIEKWFADRRPDLLHITRQIVCDNEKKEIAALFDGLSHNEHKRHLMEYLNTGRANDERLDAQSDEATNLVLALENLTNECRQPLVQLFENMLKNDSYDLLNIWEDIDWWIEQNTGCRQVMMYSITGVVGNHELMIRLSDHDFGHKGLPGFNKSQIPGQRLEEIDWIARQMFYEKNGPVTLTSLLTFWEGFKTLKDSNHPADIRSATYYYWMGKRYLQQVTIGTLLFNDFVFTKCSDRFLGRMAQMFQELETLSPKKSKLNDKYQQVFELYDKKVSFVSKWLAGRMRKNMIRKYLFTKKGGQSF